MTEENNNSSKNSRRRILKGTLLGGAAVTSGMAGNKWVKPTVQSVLLPAHANTTDSGGDPGSGTNLFGPFFRTIDPIAVGNRDSLSDSDSLLARAGDLVLPKGHASVPLTYICITMLSETAVSIQFYEWLKFPLPDKGADDQGQGDDIGDDIMDPVFVSSGYVEFANTANIDQQTTLKDINCDYFRGYPATVSNPTETSIDITIFKETFSVPVGPCRPPETACPSVIECEFCEI